MAAGHRYNMHETDVLFIVPTSLTRNPDIVQRRSRRKLTDEERKKLESQGIPRDSHHDDLGIMKARYGLDKDCTIVGVESGRELTCEGVKKQIASLMSNTDKQSIILHYIGPGKKGTGDWCFNDGFITFRELADIYTSNQHFKGQTFYIVSDCSYSGSWVREFTEFLDEHGVGPCGHAAKEKGIQITVQASSLANEIPAELVFSTHCLETDKNTGAAVFFTGFRNKEVYKGQHSSKLNCGHILCKNESGGSCTMAPGSTWKRWRIDRRTKIVTHGNNIQPEWSYVVFVDDEEILCAIIHDRKITGGLFAYGNVLVSGLGKDPPKEVEQWVDRNCRVDYNYSSS